MNDNLRSIADVTAFDEVGKDYSLYFNLTKDKVENFAHLIVDAVIEICSEVEQEYILNSRASIDTVDKMLYHEGASAATRIRERVREYFKDENGISA